MPSRRRVASRKGIQLRFDTLEQRLVLANLPTGFVEATVVSGLSGATAMEFSPDGRLFVLEQTGNVKLIHGDGTTWTALHINVDSNGERGLLGIAFDPGYSTNHFVYLYYTNPNPGGAPWATGEHNQLSRFTVDDTNPQKPVFGNEAPILDWDNLSSATNHNGGAIHFGTDGKLYADAGDNAQTFTQGGNTYRVSQTLSDLLGKQLRIDVTAFNSGLATRDDTTVGHLIPADNPFVGTASGINQLIYVLGLRNPFTFAVQPGTGKIFINDVGESTWEEIDQSVAGGNYGWSGGNTDGFGQSPPGPGTYHDPLLAYNHSGGPAGGGVAIVGGVFYNPVAPQFPSSYVDKYFYDDLAGGWIRVFDPANPGSAANPDTSTGFATNLPSNLRDLKVDSAGSLYCLEGSAIDKISYVGSAWTGYAGNFQHTALSSVASSALASVHWQTPVDLAPQYSGNDLLIHYGTPLVTTSNSVIVPVKTGGSGGFEVQARSGATGSLRWTLISDYALMPSGGSNGYDWTPSYSPTLTPANRLYFAGIGGTVEYTDSPNAAGPTPPTVSRLAFFGLSNYNANPSAYNSTIFINTPITSDAAGDIFFGFLVTGSNPLGLTSGVARIAADGTGSFVGVVAGMSQVATNSAPALSNDGNTLYALESTGNFGTGKLVALDSHTLAVAAQVALMDVHNPGNNAVITNDATASPTVGPDGDVYIGVLESPFASNHDRGWLLHFSASLGTWKTPGAFGWDDTASIVPASMVPSYQGTSTYLLMTKYNNYAGEGGDGVNKIAILDPNATMADPVTGASVMKEVLTIAGPTPDPQFTGTHPNAVREWCINTAVVDPATDSVLANSEDGTLYRWNLTTNTFTQRVVLTSGIGEAYTPTLIGVDGTVYAINNATLFAIGDISSLTVSGFPTTVTAGVSSNFTVTAYVASSSIASGYRGTVQFTSTDAIAVLPAAYTFTAADAGTHTFSATLRTAGIQSITATDTANGHSGTESGITVQGPTVTSTTPTAGATGVSTTAPNITATFNESVQTGTISFVLKDPSNNTVPASVGYVASTNTATLTPNSPLAASTTYTATVSGARDSSGNVMASPVSWSFTTAAVTYTIWSSTATPIVASFNDSSAVELGVKFNSSVAGYITGIRFYKGSGNTGMHVGHLWTSTGTLLATATFSGETASGWQQVNFSSPVAIAVGTTYIASYFAPVGHYADDHNYFASSGVTNGPLTALSNSAGGGNGVYIYGASGGFPTKSYLASNYWVDVVFSSAVSSASKLVVHTQPSATATAGTAFATQPVIYEVDQNGNLVTSDNTTVVTVALSSGTGPLQGTLTATVSGGVATFTNLADNTAETIALKFTSGSLTSATSSNIVVSPAAAAKLVITQQPSATATAGVPFAAQPVVKEEDAFNNVITTDSTHTVTAARGSTGTANLQGSNLTVTLSGGVATFAGLSYNKAEAMNIAFSTNAGSFTATSGNVVVSPTAATQLVIAQQPSATATVGVAFATQPVINEADSFGNVETGDSSTLVTVSLASGTGPLQGTTTVAVSHGVATFTNLADSTAETISLKFTSGSLMSATSNNIVVSQSSYISGATVWSSSATPVVPSFNDSNAVELGVKFQSSVAGYITGIRFYKGSGNTGTHVGHLWTSSGTLLATATFSGETASGWQQVNFSAPAAIAAGTTYVASYFAPAGHYADDHNYFASSGVTNGPLTALSNSTGGGNGVYIYGSSGGFPTKTYLATNYWVDVVFGNQPSPPTVSGETPAPGATGVSTNTPNITATFSEPVTSGTISFVLKDPSQNLVPASLSYNASTKTATLTPNAPLLVSTTYTATVSGAQDAAGNAMTGPFSWSFTTGSVAMAPPGPRSAGSGSNHGYANVLSGSRNDRSNTAVLDAVLAEWLASDSSTSRNPKSSRSRSARVIWLGSRRLHQFPHVAHAASAT
jgi:glucose/arabinose dehydrogenase